MRMIRAGIDFQFFEDLPAQWSFWQHTLDSESERAGGMFVHQLAQGEGFQAAGITRMPIVGLVIHAFAGDMDLIGIYDNHVIASIQVWGEVGLVRAAQNRRYF